MKNLFKSLVVAIITWEARLVLKKYRPKIVAVTGSVGKTSTKDAIYAVLSKKFHVRGSEKSFNSEVGLPLTILGAPNAWNNPLRWLSNIGDGLLLILFSARYPEWLVLEVGADRPGDISSLRSWLKTDVVVITKLPDVPVHVEFFDSPEAVVFEKASLIDTLRKGGTLLLSADDPKTKALEHREPAPDAKILLFGFDQAADIKGEKFTILRESDGAPMGMQGHILVGGESAPVEVVGTVGVHAFLPGVAAAAVGCVLGMTLPEIVQGLQSYTTPPGRMRLIKGIKDTIVIDDTYNASPAATVAALDTLEHLVKKSGRCIAVLGDMLELGRFSVEEHRKVGAAAAKCADILVTVGFRSHDMAQGALDNGMPDVNILQYEDSRKAGEELKNMIEPGDCILVKGSQSMRMERVVEELMAEPELASKLLVRQDAEWKKR